MATAEREIASSECVLSALPARRVVAASAATLSIGLAACGEDTIDGAGAGTTDATVAPSVPVTSVVETLAPVDGGAGAPPTSPSGDPGRAADRTRHHRARGGRGPRAAAGDTVVVDYVGVRSSDGVEFDNSYDRGEPFPVVLGPAASSPVGNRASSARKRAPASSSTSPPTSPTAPRPAGDIIGRTKR